MGNKPVCMFSNFFYLKVRLMSMTKTKPRFLHSNIQSQELQLIQHRNARLLNPTFVQFFWIYADTEHKHFHQHMSTQMSKSSVINNTTGNKQRSTPIIQGSSHSSFKWAHTLPNLLLKFTTTCMKSSVKSRLQYNSFFHTNNCSLSNFRYTYYIQHRLIHFK